jgi:hypothetical protein
MHVDSMSDLIYLLAWDATECDFSFLGGNAVFFAS